jgi:amidophosphoribosyltransferase
VVLLIKSRYIGRTFIQPGQRIRDLGVRIKFSPLSKILVGKNIVLVDDSVVRGTTISKIIKLLKKAGVAKIHLRIASPPFKHTCYLGIDVKRYKELIANYKTVEQIRKSVGADSLGYLSLAGLKKAIGKTNCNFCTGCFTGAYPVS